jgi:glycosyltransferase involved in cell wall biosynthesis
LKTVDVVVPTKDSSATLGIVLNAIRGAIPVNKLIIVDGGSSDATVQIAKKHGAKIVQEQGKLGRARYRGALEVETEWFCSIDSDILIYPVWYEKLKRWTHCPKVAWVNGLPLEQSKVLKSYARAKFLRHRREMKSVQVALSNSLLKRDVVLECTEWLREDIHAGEDLVLYNFIRSKGYQRVGPNFAVSLHLPDCFLHDVYAFYRGGYSMRLVHKRIRAKYVGLPFHLLLNASYGFIDTMDPRLFAYHFGMQGGAFLIKYLGIAGKSMDQFMERTEVASKILGANLFLNGKRELHRNDCKF